METLRHWSLARVLLTSVAWVCLTILAAVSLFVFQMWRSVAASGGGGIGAVSFGVNLLVLAVPFLPPILLLIVWLIVRR